ncbi:MAG: hypothetical protein KGI71_06220 [Patescibacteria group bacterium]|nr:hypothetical protein [Patescibacteria group bacterium]
MKTSVRQLKVGDTIAVWWKPNRDTITKLTRYDGPLLGLLGEGTMLAEFALNKTGMTLEAGSFYEVFNR